jgi:hypothetical protein
MLTGCFADPARQPPHWEARVSGDQLQIAACELLQGDALDAVVEQSAGPRWREFWTAHGPITVNSGEVLRAGQPVPGVTQTYDGSAVTDGGVIVVFLNADGVRVARAKFDFSGEVPTGHWLRPDGSTHETACAE